MIIHTRSAEVVVCVLRRLPEINSPDALRRMVDAMVAQSQNYHGLAKQVVAHAGNRAGVETNWKRGTGALEVTFCVPPGTSTTDLVKGAWIAKLVVEIRVDPEGAESFFFALSIRHDNAIRDVRLLAAALIAEDEQKCTTTVSFIEGNIHNLNHALQVALTKT